MVSEEAAIFRSEEEFATGIRDSFNRNTGRRPLRKARGELPKDHDVARAVLLGRIKSGGTHRRARRSGGNIKHIPAKAVGGLLSLGYGFQPASCLAKASSSRPGWEAHSPGPDVSAAPETFRERAGGSRPVHLDWVGETSAM